VSRFSIQSFLYTRAKRLPKESGLKRAITKINQTFKNH